MAGRLVVAGNAAPDPAPGRASLGPCRPRRVLLVGYEDQDNLGIRYLSSRLLEEGHHTRIVAFGTDPAPLLRIIELEQPDVVGFSLIFQYMVPEFAAVIRALRAAGVRAHFTIGGHYASFEPEALLERIPELDSVVRFEGEDTLAELIAKLDEPSAWRGTPGIAWLDDGKPVKNPPRAGRTSIDDFAEPDRRDIDYRQEELPTASVLASRGCPWKCSFCSIITFYEGNGTKGRRRRDPERVVNEVEGLVRERGAKLILFQDDDFLAGAATRVPGQSAWPPRSCAAGWNARCVSRSPAARTRFAGKCWRRSWPRGSATSTSGSNPATRATSRR
jgi:radical SAM superfamily enzyme YgiQ (UPF0313 family)